MRIIALTFILLVSMSCESATKYKSELTQYPNHQLSSMDDFDEYDLKDHQLKVSLRYQANKLYLKFENNSDNEFNFLPLDVNLATDNERCTIKEIYEDFIWKSSNGKKVDFKTNYVLAKKTSKNFFYKFRCHITKSAYLTINGLKIADKKITLNFRLKQQ